MGKTLLFHKKAKFEYEVLEKIEAGVVLSGGEVKSLREGRGAMADAHVVFSGGQASLINLNIPNYKFEDSREYEPTRSRRLLLHKREVWGWEQKAATKGMSVIPLRIYVKKGRIKVELGLVRGKKQFEKREAIKKRDLEREVRQEFKHRLR